MSVNSKNDRDFSADELEGRKAAVLDLVLPRVPNDDAEEVRSVVFGASNSDELRVIWRRLLSDETGQDISTLLGDVANIDRAQDHLYPEVLGRMAGVSYVSQVDPSKYWAVIDGEKEEPEILLTDTDAEEEEEVIDPSKYPYEYVSIVSPDKRRVNIDCTSEHFGHRAGDIAAHEWVSSSMWSDSNVFIEGFSYNEDEHSVVMWGRKIHRGGGLDSKMYYTAHSKEDSMKLLHRWGEYDPADFGIDPEKRVVDDDVRIIEDMQVSEPALDPSKVAKGQLEAFLKTSGEAKAMDKISLDDESYKIEGVFDEYLASVMRLELEDLLKRMHLIFPIKNYDQLLRELAMCRVPLSVQSFNDAFFGDLSENLDGEYPYGQILKIEEYIASHRESFDVETLLRESITWMHMSVELKTRIRLNYELPDGDVAKAFPLVIDKLVSQVADFITPLFDGSVDEQERVELYNKKPHYFKQLMDNYDNPYSAARHVVGVSLNAVGEMLGRAVDYDYKHVVDTDSSQLSDSGGVEGYRNLFFMETDPNAVDDISAAVSAVRKIVMDFDIATAVENCLYGEDGLVVTRETNLGEFLVFMDKIRVIFSNLKNKVFEEAGPLFDAVAPDMSDRLSGIFDTLVVEYLENTGIKEDVLDGIKATIAEFLDDPGLVSKKVGAVKKYPFITVDLGGDHVDCQRNFLGMKGGDIVRFRGALRFFEGHELRGSSDWAFIALRNLDSGDFDWESKSDVSGSDFEVVHRWGDYDPDEFNLDVSSRNGNPFVNNFDGIASERFTGGLIKPLTDLSEQISSRDERIDGGFGKYISTRIIRDLNNASGKELPMQTQLLYFDRDTYSVYPFAPPSSSHSNVMRFEISTGCSYRRCTYCTLYENEDFTLKTPEEFEEHFQMVKEFGDGVAFGRNVDRVFLTGGNGLAMPTDDLCNVLEYVSSNMPRRMKRMESYATTHVILKHGDDGLRRLHRSGLNLVYWGVESCNDDVLRLVKKGYKGEQVVEAGKMLRGAGIQTSITVMPGLGGIKFSDQHADDTARIMGDVHPTFLTLMSTHSPLSCWETDIDGAEDNRQLTTEEMIAEIERMRKVFRERAQRSPVNRDVYARIAAHGPDVTPASRNPITFSDRF